MGRAAVRQAVATAVQNAAIPYVGTVYPARPTIIQEPDYIQTLQGQAIQESVNGSACVIVVDIPSDHRQLRAFTGRIGVEDTNIHALVLELFFASTGGDAMAAQQDYDTIIDGLFALIRNNPTLSAPSTIWSAGEYREGVQHAQSEPESSADGLTILINGAVRFSAYEWVAGVGV